MSPLISTIVSILFLIAGGIGVFTMLSVQGRKELPDARRLIRRHKAMGWAFVVLFLVMFVSMLGRIAEYWEESSARVALHVALSVGLLFLLIIKVMIPRFYPRLAKHLFSLGIAAYLTGFVLVLITGGYYVARAIQGTPYISNENLPEHMRDLQFGKELFVTKCTTCHSLDRIMSPRSPENWAEVITEMVEIAEPRIRPDEASQILYYLSETHTPKRFEGPGEPTLLEKHCLPCHDAPDILQHGYTRAGWLEIVRQMNEYDPGIVPEDKFDEIVDYLLKTQGVE